MKYEPLCLEDGSYVIVIHDRTPILRRPRRRVLRDFCRFPYRETTPKVFGSEADARNHIRWLKARNIESMVKSALRGAA